MSSDYNKVEPISSLKSLSRNVPEGAARCGPQLPYICRLLWLLGSGVCDSDIILMKSFNVNHITQLEEKLALGIEINTAELTTSILYNVSNNHKSFHVSYITGSFGFYV